VTFNLFTDLLVSGGGPLRQTEILVTTAFRWSTSRTVWRRRGVASTRMIILLVLTLLTNRITKATESYV